MITAAMINDKSELYLSKNSKKLDALVATLNQVQNGHHNRFIFTGRRNIHFYDSLLSFKNDPDFDNQKQFGIHNNHIGICSSQFNDLLNPKDYQTLTDVIEESDDGFTGHPYLQYFVNNHLLQHYGYIDKGAYFIYIKLNQPLNKFSQNQLRAILIFIQTVKNLIDYQSDKSFVSNQFDQKGKNQQQDIKTEGHFNYALVFDYHNLLNSKIYIQSKNQSGHDKTIKTTLDQCLDKDSKLGKYLEEQQNLKSKPNSDANNVYQQF